MSEHNILELLDEGLMVTVNSDDPSYFGGYLNQNYVAIADKLPLTQASLLQLVRNSVTASFLPDQDKAELLLKIK
jgi:adenosine deaminase